VDDYWSHMSRRRFDLDRARKWELLECGWRVGEVTSKMMTDQPREVVWRIATVLGLEPARWRKRA
jgi:very-short-patch-repair endonuclease